MSLTWPENDFPQNTFVAGDIVTRNILNKSIESVDCKAKLIDSLNRLIDIQTELMDERNRIYRLNNQLAKVEEENESLIKELEFKDEKVKTILDISASEITQLNEAWDKIKSLEVKIKELETDNRHLAEENQSIIKDRDTLCSSADLLKKKFDYAIRAKETAEYSYSQANNLLAKYQRNEITPSEASKTIDVLRDQLVDSNETLNTLACQLKAEKSHSDFVDGQMRKLLEELKSSKQDAKRYQYIRNHSGIEILYHGEALDRNIDTLISIS